MVIKDLRPLVQRWLERSWRGGRRDPGQASEPRSSWLDPIVGHFMGRRVAARRQPADRPLLVSVGNLALGGTGKTPVVTALADAMAQHGHHGAVLTRGYRSVLPGPLVVDPDNRQAGDEARLMAAALASAGWPVVQSRRRCRGLEFLEERYPDLDLVIIEDGHQTARLGRHLDILILDSWRLDQDGGEPIVVPMAGPVFPLGAYREPASGAERAAIWLIESRKTTPAGGRGGARVVSFHRRIRFRDVGQETLASGQPVALLSGIAQPEVFERSVTALLPEAPVLALRFGDHAAYDAGRAARIESEMTAAGCTRLVTTAKDWVKLAACWQGPPVTVAELSVIWGNNGTTLPQLVEERLMPVSRSIDEA